MADDLGADDLRPRPESLLERLAATAAAIIQPRPEQLDDSTGRAERRLHEFARQAWHVVEPAREFVDGWHLGLICEHLQALSDLQIRNLIINVPPRHMKLCADSTPVATPDGYKTHGEIKAGDRVFGPDGKPTRVLRISAKGVADHEVEFSTGEVVKCNGDHLWTVYDRWAKQWKTLRTNEIRDAATELDRSRFFIPDEPRLEFPERALPLHPYFLGCWLGDGTSVKPAITHDARDVEHLEKLARLGYRVTARYYASAVTSEFRHQGVAERLRALGVHGRKHIPDAYATASDEQRMELLAGLIDTDGHVEAATGRVRISTCDAALAGDIRRLAVSLGFRAYVNEADSPGYGEYKSAGKVYQVGFQPDRPIPTALPRKRIARTDYVKRKRSIVAVRAAAEPEPGHCLTVGRQDGLYLCGAGNVITHNSLLCCVFWFCWGWMRDPSSRWMYGSYGENLVSRDAQYCLDVLDSTWFRVRWGHVFRMRRRALDKLTNDRQGYRIAATVLGKIMGEGGDYLIWDDPHKPQEILSAARRAEVIRTWTQAMSTRGNDPARIRKLVVMQRLHERDLCGYLLAERGSYDHLCLPAEYEPARYFLPFDVPAPAGGDGAAERPAKVRDAIRPTSLQRARPELLDPRAAEGELLWPERFGPDAIEELKAELEATGWAGQGQQRPAPAEGTVYKAEFFRRFELEEDAGGRQYAVLREPDAPAGREPPRLPVDDLRFFQCVDTALTDNPTSAYTAVGTFAWHRPSRTLLVWHVWRAKLEVHEQMAALEQMRDGCGRWSPGTRQWAVPGAGRPWPRPVMFQGVENKASGVGFLQEARLRNLPLVELKGDQNPVVRAAAVVTMCRNGKVWHRAGAPWLIDFEDELLTFPRGAFADQATVLAYAGICAGRDALLNADIEGDLNVWPPAPEAARDRGERELHPDYWSGDRETLDVGGVEVEFNDRRNWWEGAGDAEE